MPKRRAYFLWCLNGLQRLIENNFQFTISQQTEDNMLDAISDGNHIVDFMRSEGYIEFRADAETSSKQLYSVYETWCEGNAYEPYSPRSFSQFLTEHDAIRKWESGNGNARTALEQALSAKFKQIEKVPKILENQGIFGTFLVREAGVEPARPEWALEPESSESANSTTRALAFAAASTDDRLATAQIE